MLAIGLDPTRALVLSQVILSFGIPFALIPVVAFTRRRDLMGNLVNHPLTTAAASWWPYWWSRSTPSCSGRSSPVEAGWSGVAG